MAKPNILFLCTHNSARSQMAEAILRRYVGDRYQVHSAGLESRGVNPFTIRVMNESGYDMSEHYSKDITTFMGKMHFKYVVTVCANADEQCPQAFWATTAAKLHWPFDDPSGATGTDDEKLAKFREVRDQIDARIKVWLAEIGEPVS